MPEIPIIRARTGKWRALYRRLRRCWWVRVCGFDGVAYDDAEDGRDIGDHDVVPPWKLPRARTKNEIWLAEARLRRGRPSETCPRCGRPFSDWFFWPGIGNYCWPCYHWNGIIIAKSGMVYEETPMTLDELDADVSAKGAKPTAEESKACSDAMRAELEVLDSDFLAGGPTADAVARGLAKDLAKGNT